jgi:hypothetical protein
MARAFFVIRFPAFHTAWQLLQSGLDSYCLLQNQFFKTTLVLKSVNIRLICGKKSYFYTTKIQQCFFYTI